jgi:hypothetical protein
MVVQKLIDSGMDAVGLRPVSWQQSRVREAAHQQQRLQVISERERSEVRLKADRRSDVRQDVVAGEEHTRLVVTEDEVPAGVTGRGNRSQGAVRDRYLCPVRHPVVRLLPEVARHLVVGSAHRLGNIRCSAGIEQHELAAKSVDGAGGQLKRTSLSCAQGDAGGVFASQRDGLGVVVAMNMRNQHLQDVSHLELKCFKCPNECRPAVGKRLSGVDQHHPVCIQHNESVHSVQAVLMQG